MDAQIGLVIQAMLVIAAFAAANERIIESLRGLGDRIKHPFPDIFTIGHLNWVPGVVVALVTQADALELFPVGGAAPTFFANYLGPLSRWGALWSAGGFGRHLAGCVMMGLSTTLGSQFWHDLAGRLVDARNAVKAVGSAPPVVLRLDDGSGKKQP